MNELLKKITEAPGTSGYEDNIRNVIENEVKRYVDNVKVDKIGNLICSIGQGGPKIMIAAHMDKLGLIVKYIDNDGFIRFGTVGGWDPRVLPSQKVVIYGSKKPVIGVIGHKPVHIQEKEESEKADKIKDMFIDIGAKNKKDVEKAGINIGDQINFYTGYDDLIGNRVVGSGFDDRIGCFEIVEIIKNVKKFKGTLYAVFTVAEEIGLVGVRGATFGVNPDVMIALDTTIAGDFPGITAGEVVPRIGKGPVIGIKDAVSVINKKVRIWLEETAKNNKIPLQYDVIDRGATDASVAAMIREGIPSGTVLTPTRYVHTSVEVVDMNDVKNVIKLVSYAINSSHKYF